MSFKPILEAISNFLLLKSSPIFLNFSNLSLNSFKFFADVSNAVISFFVLTIESLTIFMSLATPGYVSLDRASNKVFWAANTAFSFSNSVVVWLALIDFNALLNSLKASVLVLISSALKSPVILFIPTSAVVFFIFSTKAASSFNNFVFSVLSLFNSFVVSTSLELAAETLCIAETSPNPASVPPETTPSLFSASLCFFNSAWFFICSASRSAIFCSFINLVSAFFTRILWAALASATLINASLKLL